MSSLIIVDFQNDFLDDGPFKLTGSRDIVHNLNAQLDRGWDLVVASRDWHSPNHISFAETQNKPEYSPIVLSDGKHNIETLAWPTHCVADTIGAQFDPLLNQDKIDLLINKGTDPDRECFSAFKDVFGKPTPLESALCKHNIHTVYICGVVTEYCVLHTALDAVKLGFKTILLEDCIFPITPEGGQRAIETMAVNGIKPERAAYK